MKYRMNRKLALAEILQALHQHLEIAVTETGTTAIVAAKLKALGFAVTEGAKPPPQTPGTLVAPFGVNH